MPAKGTTKREPWNPLLKSYPFSERVNAISVGAETLFTRLVAQADDYGNYYGNPKKILAYLFGHRFAAGEVTATDTGRWRAELVANTCGPLAVVYTVNGAEYIHLLNPRRRIRSDVAPDERFPREPANAEEKAISEHVKQTYRKRTVNGSLDLDPHQDQDLDQEKITADSSEDFDKFWDHFKSLGRNDAKVKTRKAWAATLKGRPGANGHKPVEPSVLIEAAGHYREYCEAGKIEPRFVKQPATFLGPDRHWEDWKDKRKTNGQHNPSDNGNGLKRGADYYERARKKQDAST